MTKQSYFYSGVRYIYTTEIVETYYGPERSLTLWVENKPETAVTVQEAGSTEFCLREALTIITEE